MQCVRLCCTSALPLRKTAGEWSKRLGFIFVILANYSLSSSDTATVYTATQVCIELSTKHDINSLCQPIMCSCVPLPGGASQKHCPADVHGRGALINNDGISRQVLVDLTATENKHAYIHA